MTSGRELSGHLLIRIKTRIKKAISNKARPKSKSKMEVKTLSNGKAFIKLRTLKPANTKTTSINNTLLVLDSMNPPPDIALNLMNKQIRSGAMP